MACSSLCLPLTILCLTALSQCLPPQVLDAPCGRSKEKVKIKSLYFIMLSIMYNVEQICANLHIIFHSLDITVQTYNNINIVVLCVVSSLSIALFKLDRVPLRDAKGGGQQLWILTEAPREDRDQGTYWKNIKLRQTRSNLFLFFHSINKRKTSTTKLLYIHNTIHILTLTCTSIQK